MRKIIIITAFLFAGFLAYSYARNLTWMRSSNPNNLPTLRASRETLTESTVAVGTINPKVGAEVKVGSQISGIVADLKVSVGDEVSRGDVLATLRDDEWQARVDVLKANLASAIAEKEYAENELGRMERLAEIVPSQQIEDTRRNVKVKQAAVEAVRASLSEAEIQLRYTVIRAPVSGTIASVSTYKGETVAASLAAPTFVTIVDLKRLEVQAYVDETDIGKVHVGQHVSIRVDSYPGHDLPGTVRAIYPKAQLINNVVNYVVIIDIQDNGGLLIRPQMTAHVTFILEQREGAISIPRKALLREGGRSLVVVRQADHWSERPVQTGLQTPDRVEIVSGLHEGETIVADKQAWKDSQEKK
jgi:macrolide-specific efflux system membrane fusion protein